MEGRLIAFVIWVIIGVLFIVMGIYDFNSKKAKPFGFWANAEVAPIEDVKGYNRALGILWCVYGVLFTLIGLPLLDGQNSGLIIIPILGAMLISIAAMVAYVVLSVKLDAPAPCRLDAPDLDLICYASADCLHQHLQVI